MLNFVNMRGGNSSLHQTIDISYIRKVVIHFIKILYFMLSSSYLNLLKNSAYLFWVIVNTLNTTYFSTPPPNPITVHVLASEMFVSMNTRSP